MNKQRRNYSGEDETLASGSLRRGQNGATLRRRGSRVGLTLIVAGLLGGIADVEGQQRPQVQVSEPQGVTLAIYDEGFALVNEARRVTLTAGESELVIRQLPARLDVASAHHSMTARGPDFVVTDKRLLYDLMDAASLWRRLEGHPARIAAGAHSATGMVRLIGRPGVPSHVALETRNGVSGFPEPAITSFMVDAGQTLAYPEPTMLWGVQTRQEGPRNFRLSYRTEGLSWQAFYDVILDSEGRQADFLGKVELNNQSEGRFEEARIRLVLTERGLTGNPVAVLTGARSPENRAMRYAYGSTAPVLEQALAGLAPVEVFELPRPTTLGAGETVFIQFTSATAVPVRRFYVYDGVKFDRFQRNRRNDWSYGTESHSTVDVHLEFDNTTANGLGQGLPPGRLRLFATRGDGAMDFQGEAQMLPVPADASGNVRIGPARGLIGERERTGYVEIRPLHEYEESFEIRLFNTTDTDAEVRVVEHLYRWHDFEIVRADTEFTRAGDQTIEFRPEVRAGSRRTIGYTVRYRW